jgi:hypothetical protein
MTEQISDNPTDPNISPNLEELIVLLRRKQETWVDWGKACAVLQKSGYQPQRIFEETGFEPIQQNQVMVASQVYASLLQGEASEQVLSHFGKRGSDILYELRVLSQGQRVEVAELVLSLQLDSDEARELVKILKDSARVVNIPPEFSSQPGDLVAYHCWKTAKQHQDLQARSRLIAKGLRMVQTASARQMLERLLTDFTVTPQRQAPRLAVHRLESAEELPKILPVAGYLPLTLADWQTVPLLTTIGPFALVKSAGPSAWVAVPGWQMILQMEDPVVLISKSDQVPVALQGETEEVLIIVERSHRQWDPEHYFLVEKSGHLVLEWFEEKPDLALWGAVSLIIKPAKILDAELMKDQWQMDD